MKLPNEWKELIKDYLLTDGARELYAKVGAEYARGGVCPPESKLFSAFNAVNPNGVKVVILGQDPYHGAGQAMGMSFSVDPTADCDFPPSLRNIIKEVRAEFGSCAVENGDLTPWANQGVLLLNTCLTVKTGKPLSHNEIGWDGFTRAVIAKLGARDGIVFMLWGGHARKFRELIKETGAGGGNLVLTCAHPSPLSASGGFFGCGHFKRANEFLVAHGQKPIAW